MSEKACVHVYCTLIVSLLADKIRSRRAREKNVSLVKAPVAHFSSAYSIERACTCSSRPVASYVDIDSAIINLVSYFYNLSANKY